MNSEWYFVYAISNQCFLTENNATLCTLHSYSAATQTAVVADGTRTETEEAAPDSDAAAAAPPAEEEAPFVLTPLLSVER